MERMKKEKESGTLLGVGTAYMEVHTFEGVDYITVKDFNKAINHLQIEIGGLMGERDGKQMRIDELAEENKKLKEEREMLIEDLSSDKELQQQIAQKQLDYYRENQKLKSDLAYERTMLDNVRAEYDSLQNVNKELKEEIERMKTDTMYDMKDINSLYEENKRLKEELKKKEDDELIYEEGLYD